MLPKHCIVWVFVVFFGVVVKEFGVGAWGVVFEVFFDEFRVSGFWIPVSGRAFRKTWPGSDSVPGRQDRKPRSIIWAGAIKKGVVQLKGGPVPDDVPWDMGLLPCGKLLWTHSF